MYIYTREAPALVSFSFNRHIPQREKKERQKDCIWFHRYAVDPQEELVFENNPSFVWVLGVFYFIRSCHKEVPIRRESSSLFAFVVFRICTWCICFMCMMLLFFWLNVTDSSEECEQIVPCQANCHSKWHVPRPNHICQGRGQGPR